ncbi:LANO_0B02586g1_1 [Lachancea nothofagi CBS 11611]|uniref:LANO_0B02586g1_1 n=1 Tax=Lachancea nothofagi CBS 11611 TaxID=1266666 RepID=A0A1G4IW11_9SACH|nr:LANO_0B02586g1_1 [Lachancea nothofagi CBS 11611]
MSTPSQHLLIAERDALLSERNELRNHVQRLESQELVDKYDALPLLNRGTRLKFLQDFYPLLKIHTIDYRNSDELDVTSTDASNAQTSPFGSLSDSPLKPARDFQNINTVHVTFSIDCISVSLQYSTENSQMTQLKILRISPLHLSMEALIRHCEKTLNLSYFLSGCYEFIRINNFRAGLWSGLIDSQSYLQPQLKSPECMQLTSQKTKLALQISYCIEFDSLPFPDSIVSVKLYSEMEEVPHANDICSSLIKEYGLEYGLREFIRAVLS